VVEKDIVLDNHVKKEKVNGAPGSNTMSRVSVLDYLSSGTCAQRPIEGLTNILS